jgi:hypothetical protein
MSLKEDRSPQGFARVLASRFDKTNFGVNERPLAIVGQRQHS